jgi:hypothetical protein
MAILSDFDFRSFKIKGFSKNALKINDFDLRKREREMQERDRGNKERKRRKKERKKEK